MEENSTIIIRNGPVTPPHPSAFSDTGPAHRLRPIPLPITVRYRRRKNSRLPGGPSLSAAVRRLSITRRLRGGFAPIQPRAAECGPRRCVAWLAFTAALVRAVRLTAAHQGMRSMKYGNFQLCTPEHGGTRRQELPWSRKRLSVRRLRVAVATKSLPDRGLAAAQQNSPTGVPGPPWGHCTVLYHLRHKWVLCVNCPLAWPLVPAAGDTRA